MSTVTPAKPLYSEFYTGKPVMHNGRLWLIAASYPMRGTCDLRRKERTNYSGFAFAYEVPTNDVTSATADEITAATLRNGQ